MPKPEVDLDFESAEEHSDLPEQSSESSSNDSSSETSVSSCESYNVHEDEGNEELSPKEETETASTAERAPSTPDEVSSNQTVVLGEGISQISESSYQTALASTSSTEPDDVANTVEGYDNIEDVLQQYVNASCSGNRRFNSKYLRKIQIVVSEVKYKRRNVILLSFRRYQRCDNGRAKLHCHLQSFHQRELRVSNLRRINLEIEELEGSKEIATTDLRKLHKEKDQTYRLITYEGQYKYNIAVFKKCKETNRFTDKLIVVRDPTETENPTADNYAPCPDCFGFFMRKTSTGTN